MKLTRKFFKFINSSKVSIVLIQFIKFALVGASNALINLCVYYFLVYFIKTHYIFASIVGFVVSVLNSYFWNSKFVFSKNSFNKTDQKRLLIKTFVAYGTTFMFNILLMYLFVDIFKISKALAPIICILLVTPVNFLINKFWVYKKVGE